VRRVDRKESQHKPNQKTLNPAESATDWGSFRAKGVPGGALREAETAVRAGESGFWPGGAEARACALWGAGGVAILPHSPEEWIRRRCSFPFGSNLSSHVFPPAHEVGEGPQVEALPQMWHAGSSPCSLQGLPSEADSLISLVPPCWGPRLGTPVLVTNAGDRSLSERASLRPTLLAAADAGASSSGHSFLSSLER